MGWLFFHQTFTQIIIADQQKSADLGMFELSSFISSNSPVICL